MAAVYTVSLAIGAFILGAVPFSVIVGRWLLKKDITKYGDGNPGGANVFRAGGRKTGFLAVILDIIKGIPFVLIAHLVFDLSGLAVAAVAVAAVLGHAYSPFLHWRGGKAISITFGTMLGLMPQYQVFLVFLILMIIGALFIKNDAWGVVLATVATLIYFTIVKGYSWEPLMMLCMTAILVIKHFEDLHTLPSLRGRLIRLFQTR
ncbi:MAG: glycerol-3-phosphate acyltransferase [Dehalococcoidales bacterium]